MSSEAGEVQWAYDAILTIRPSPSSHECDRHRDLNAAVPSATMQHMEGQRPLAAIEVGLGFHTDLLSPYVLKIPVPPAQAIVSVIDTPIAANAERSSTLGSQYAMNASMSRALYASLRYRMPRTGSRPPGSRVKRQLRWSWIGSAMARERASSSPSSRRETTARLAQGQARLTTSR